MRDSIHLLILAATFFTTLIPGSNANKVNYRASSNKYCDSNEVRILTNYKEIKTLEQLLIQFKGKFVFIDLWATWCSPCLEEFNNYKTLYASLQKNNIVLLYISIDDDTSDLKWKSFIKQYNLPGIHVRANKELKNEITMLIWNAVDVYSIPHHLLFDYTGKLIDKNASIVRITEVLQKNK